MFDIVRGFAWPQEYPGRAVKNAFLEKWHHQETELDAARLEEEKVFVASHADDLSFRAVWVGEGADLVTELMSAADIVERIVSEAVTTMEAGMQLLGRARRQ